MDYKTTYLGTYESTMLDQEKITKKELLKYKDNKRTYYHACGEVGKLLLNTRIEFETLYPFRRYNEYIETFQKKDEVYSEDQLNLVLQDKMKTLFENGENFGISNYNSFIQKFAMFMALEDARKNFGAQNWLNELYFENDEIEKISLRPLKEDIKKHKDFIRLNSIKFPENEKFTEPESKKTVKKSKMEVSLGLPILDNDEKLLLVHYLLHSNSLEKIEKIKILALLETTPVGLNIFKQESRKNNDYNQILKGFKYLGKKNARKKLTSLYDQVVIFKIDNLNRAIKMDLNKLRNEEIKDNLNST